MWKFENPPFLYIHWSCMILRFWELAAGISFICYFGEQVFSIYYYLEVQVEHLLNDHLSIGHRNVPVLLSCYSCHQWRQIIWVKVRVLYTFSCSCVGDDIHYILLQILDQKKITLLNINCEIKLKSQNNSNSCVKQGG